MKTYGQIAYDAYFEHSGGRSLVSGAPLPTWAAQNPKIADAWEASAQAVIKADLAVVAETMKGILGE